jgi:excisionase family DNA binding protein
MRSLQDWMRYLEQQEESLRKEPETKPSRASRPVVEREQHDDVGLTETDGAGIAAPEKPRVVPSAPRPQTPARSEAAASVTTPPVVRQRKKRTQRAPAPDSGKREIAQKSYKPFRESRADLLQRLLDPMISLEEAARLLNVCPTTVRRYTNRGILTHHRTAGNQRRFKLSDVLAFMESDGSGSESAE